MHDLSVPFINRSSPQWQGGLLAKLVQVPFPRTTRQCVPILLGKHPSTLLVATLANDPHSLSEPSGATHVLPRRCRQSPGTHSPFPAGILVEKPLWSRTLFIQVKLPSSPPAAPQRPLPPTRCKMTAFCHRGHHGLDRRDNRLPQPPPAAPPPYTRTHTPHPA